MHFIAFVDLSIFLVAALRHSGVTLQLNAGVPASEVARRAGHSVAVLLRVYAGCIEGHEQRARPSR